VAVCVRSGVLCLHAVIRQRKQPALCYRFFTFVVFVCVIHTHSHDDDAHKSHGWCLLLLFIIVFASTLGK
jgi:hypothetical protein